MKKSGGTLIFLCLTAMTSSAPAADNWVDCSANLLAGKVQSAGFTGFSGARCNRLTGDLYMNCIENGIWKSPDKGATWTRVDNNTVGGRLETGWGMDQDQSNPARMAVFSLDGSAGWTADGTTWKAMTGVGRNWDYGSVDWASANPRTIFASAHETGGLLYVSPDGGVSWTLLSVKINSGSALANDAVVGVMDSTTLIYGNGANGINRSTDKGATWTQVSTINPRTRTPMLFKGKFYLGGTAGLLVSADKGATWTKQGATVNICQGPFFEADENTLVIVGTAGIYKTTNAGASWTKVADLKPDVNTQYELSTPYYWSTYAWDPVNNSVYATAMDNHGFRLDLPTGTSVQATVSPENMTHAFSIVNSTITSTALFDRIELCSLSGRLLAVRQIAPAYSAAVPESNNRSRSPVIVRISTEYGTVQELSR